MIILAKHAGDIWYACRGRRKRTTSKFFLFLKELPQIEQLCSVPPELSVLEELVVLDSDSLSLIEMIIPLSRFYPRALSGKKNVAKITQF
jgi:hypothetical protein